MPDALGRDQGQRRATELLSGQCSEEMRLYKNWGYYNLF